MNFPFPYLDVLVLPTGATTGRRIVLLGSSGTINFFDSTNFLMGTLTVVGGIPGFYIFGNDGSQVALAKVNASGKAEMEQISAAATRFRIRDARIETDTIQAAVGPVGAITGKLEVFSLAGASLGFIPIYATIT